MKFKIGDYVVCVRPNINAPDLMGRIGIVRSYDGSSSYPYRVDFMNGYRIWCEVTLCTKLHRLLEGIE